jgi:anthranilate synthase/aminodeoxychorismate synthase-like glutamine amidotransferase
MMNHTKMILLIDHFDSFVHNLARYFERLGQPTRVVRCDAIDAMGVRAMRPQAVVLSPGPCTPNEAGASLDIVRMLYQELPMLGVCLGQQTIAAALGGRIVRTHPVHGQATAIRHEGTGLFAGLPSPLAVGRYHSLVVEPVSLPDELQPTAWSDAGELMALQHSALPLYGVQFHPESILTEHGYAILANFLRQIGRRASGDAATLASSELSQSPAVSTA